MTLYANINATSKYYTSQCRPQPFEVQLDNESWDAYCWAGNNNQYRTSDLDFYCKNNDGTFVPHGLLESVTELLDRSLQQELDYVKAQLDNDELAMQDSLYERRDSSTFNAMRELLALIPDSPPVCRDCGRKYGRCECNDGSHHKE